MKEFILLILKKPDIIIPITNEPTKERRMEERIPGEKLLKRVDEDIRKSIPEIMISKRKNKDIAPRILYGKR